MSHYTAAKFKKPLTPAVSQLGCLLTHQIQNTVKRSAIPNGDVCRSTNTGPLRSSNRYADSPTILQRGSGHTWLIRVQYGIGVPKGGVATNAAEAEKIAKSIGMPHGRNTWLSQANARRR
jgi:hypothetical protein